MAMPATTTTIAGTGIRTERLRPRRMPRVRPPAVALPAPALLQLMWLASPALPVGGFSYSEGLETAVDEGRVSDEAGAALLSLIHISEPTRPY